MAVRGDSPHDVVGAMSPYPTVVIVLRAHHMVVGMDVKVDGMAGSR